MTKQMLIKRKNKDLTQVKPIRSSLKNLAAQLQIDSTKKKRRKQSHPGTKVNGKECIDLSLKTTSAKHWSFSMKQFD